MGYYTHYTLEILKDPNNQEEKFYKEFEKLAGEIALDFKKDLCVKAKWYNWEDDMITLSKKFPKMLFILNGDGEERLNMWVAHFCNGKCNYREMSPHWEEFNPEEFYNSSKS